jgi:hypothetical protein
MLKAVSAARHTLRTPPGGDDLAELRLAGLRSERRPDFLRQRGGYSRQCRAGVIESANRVHIILQFVACHRLDDHQRALWLQGLANMRCRSHGISHVVQTIKERDQIEILLQIFLSCRHLESGVRNNTMFAGMRSGVLDRPGRKS